MAKKDLYESMKDRATKNTVAADIVAEMRKKGSRFLQFCEYEQMWFDSGDAKAVEKTKQRFRELREPRVRNKQRRQQETVTLELSGSEGNNSSKAGEDESSPTSKATSKTGEAKEEAEKEPDCVGYKENDTDSPSACIGQSGRRFTATNSSWTSLQQCRLEEMQKLREAHSQLQSLLSSRMRDNNSFPTAVAATHMTHETLSMQERLARLHSSNFPDPPATSAATRLNALSVGLSIGNLSTLGPDHTPKVGSDSNLTPLRGPTLRSEQPIGTLYGSSPGESSFGDCASLTGMDQESELLRSRILRQREATRWMRHSDSRLGQYSSILPEFDSSLNARIANAGMTAGLSHGLDPPEIQRRVSAELRHISDTLVSVELEDKYVPKGDSNVGTIDRKQSPMRPPADDDQIPTARDGKHTSMSCGSSMDMSLFSNLSDKFPGIDKVEHRLTHIPMQDLESESEVAHEEMIKTDRWQKKGLIVETVDVVFADSELGRERNAVPSDNDSTRSVLTMSDLGTGDLGDCSVASRRLAFQRSESARSILSDFDASHFDEATIMSQG